MASFNNCGLWGENDRHEYFSLCILSFIAVEFTTSVRDYLNVYYIINNYTVSIVFMSYYGKKHEYKIIGIILFCDLFFFYNCKNNGLDK